MNNSTFWSTVQTVYCKQNIKIHFRIKIPKLMEEIHLGILFFESCSKSHFQNSHLSWDIWSLKGTKITFCYHSMVLQFFIASDGFPGATNRYLLFLYRYRTWYRNPRARLRDGDWQYLKAMCSRSASVSNDWLLWESRWCILLVFRALGGQEGIFPPFIGLRGSFGFPCGIEGDPLVSVTWGTHSSLRDKVWSWLGPYPQSTKINEVFHMGHCK